MNVEPLFALFLMVIAVLVLLAAAWSLKTR